MEMRRLTITTSNGAIKDDIFHTNKIVVNQRFHIQKLIRFYNRYNLRHVF
jgi:hypothetical protein